MKLTCWILSLALVSTTVSAQTKTFKVGNSPTHQLVQVESVTELETFTGRTEKATGSITFDPTKRTGGGRITVDLASLDTGIPLRNDHMRSSGWLDTSSYPTAIFEVNSVQARANNQYSVTGKFTLRGVTKTVTTQATVRHMKASPQTEKAGFKGDVLQVRASFPVKLSDYGIKISGPATGKVAETVRVSVTFYGQTG
ncbi:MAG: YceI family protein [Fimbriimonadaceae bacterium]|nr:YceI family protein [Fimbriimonadaceae bacterium]QYK59417.1 MAG: YceI family protein [Fimbriimonadaceae bacterium]